MASVAENPDSTTTSKYVELCNWLREVNYLRGAAGLLGWDEQVMLPEGGLNARGKQKAALAACLHDRQSDTKLGDLIKAAESEADSMSSMEKANVRDARRSYDLRTKLSRELAAKEAELEVEGFIAWKKARETSDFSTFEPVLQKIFDLRKEIASTTRPGWDTYDACIDLFERGMTAERLSEIFDELKAGLIPLLNKIRKALPDAKALPESLKGSSEWDAERQATMCEEIARAIGFDFKRGRLDVSVHPFTGGTDPSDVRITTRYSSGNPWEGIMGTIHEVGHAMYEQGRNEEFAGLPVSESLSMGAHESQSLFWERCIGQSRGFWKFAAPIVHRLFPHTKDATANDFYRGVNRVMPDCLIRVETDEVTYPLHVILRFELERGVLDGSISVSELPKLWNEKFKQYLGTVPDSDATGVLQDVHWSGGAIGYFPTYTLGAIAAVQWYNAVQRAIPDLEEKMAQGNYEEIKSWLNENVHKVGSLYPSLDELLETGTGEPLNVKYFIQYLTEKYSELYNI